MPGKNYVFIARSMDGFIADKNGGIDFLQTVPNPENLDMGYNAFMDKIDAIVMGRKTFEVVLGFDIPWPYAKPVFVASNTLKEIPGELKDKVELVNGTVKEIVAHINQKGASALYVDGGTLIQGFLQEDLIDEMIISTIPVLLGGGASLFGQLAKPMEFVHVNSELLLGAITQDTYSRKREI